MAGCVLDVLDLNASIMLGLVQAITSIAVHPRNPNIFCTTSRDLTTRVYNLNLEPQRGEPNNPPCPPATWQSRAGPAHGLEMSEPEGMGQVGRCVVVLMGARSGGHQAEVLGAVSSLFRLV